MRASLFCTRAIDVFSLIYGNNGGQRPCGEMEALEAAFAPTYKANLMVWPFIQAVNFAFVPLELRVLVVNAISLGMPESLFERQIFEDILTYSKVGTVSSA